MGELSMRRPGPSVSRGIYGFVLYLASKLTFALFITWILVPQSWIDYYNIDDFLPSKYWILAFPTWLFIAVTFIWLIYFAINEKLAYNLNYS